MAAAVAAASLHPDQDTDPRELEAFAERFKQRRIKLGKYLKEKHWILYSIRVDEEIFQSDVVDLIQSKSPSSILDWFSRD
jgi:Pou domain - N-terminal to homeobox domain